MTLLGWVAQGLAFMGMICNMVTAQMRKRWQELVLQISENILYGFSYICLNSWSGLSVCLVSVVECVIAYYYDGKHIKDPTVPDRMPLWMLVLLEIMITSLGFLTYKDLFDIIPIANTALYTWAVWQTNLTLYRVEYATISVGWFIFNWHVKDFVPMFTAVLEGSSAVEALIRIDLMDYRKKKAQQKADKGNM